ncbi:hypothetical protein KPH14_002765 [Odynerus spinipes]|uniref:LEM domain-containing protein n=1 Tax=Odynerus spinipes TaxID=1348599 RepID=A0AAD9RLN6_9HYME|nr:hypothetical protein KPH14_002765 [Odynerus spinipes]
MLATPKNKGDLFLASSLCDGLEDSNIKQVTTLILNKEADPNVLIPTHGITPFHLVIGNDSEIFAEEVTRLFLRHGGNPNVKSADGLTPVHVAAAWGRIRILELLLANGGDPLQVDDEGRSPFHYAFDGKYYKAVTLLGKYCGYSISEDEKPKYKISLDKIVLNNGNTIAEYVMPKNPSLSIHDVDLSKMTQNCYNENTSSSIGIFYMTSDILSVGYKEDLKDDELDINFENLCINENNEKEKLLISEIINSLSTSLTSDSTINETFFPYLKDKKKNMPKRSSPKSCILPLSPPYKEKSPQFNLIKSRKKCITPKFKQKSFLSNDSNKAVIESNKCKSTKKCNTNSYKLTFMSPNILDNSIISTSPNFYTPMSAKLKQNMAKTLNIKSYFLSNNSRKEYIDSTFISYPKKHCNTSPVLESNEQNKEIIKSTPRRKRRYLQTPCRDIKQSYCPYRKNEIITTNYVSKLHSEEKRYIDTNKNTKYLDETFNYISSDTSVLSLSPNDSYFSKQTNNANNKYIDIDKGVAIKLHEGKYDDDDNMLSCEPSTILSESDNLIMSSSTSQSSINSKFGGRKLPNTKINNLQDKKIDKFGTIKQNISLLSSSISYISVQEEYIYEDPEEGVILLERRKCTTPASIQEDNRNNELSLNKNKTNLSRQSSNFPSELLLIDDHTLRQKLTELGDSPGPITSTTRHLYLKRLVTIQNTMHTTLSSSKNVTNVNQMKPWLTFGDWVDDLSSYDKIAHDVFREFVSPDPSRRWREGISKTSFNYLLLDPRITQNLPYRTAQLRKSEIWTTFLSSIFYIGKGKRSRPYSHLYDAFNIWVSKEKKALNKKIKRILDIWSDGYGVICLHVFQNTIPVEAYTREAAMIDALGIDHLTNCKNGEYYGVIATWNTKDKCRFGRYLLYKALQILLHEGERELTPEDL